MQIISRSGEQTKNLASNFAQKYKSGGVIALYGDLGAGKTTFTQGFAAGLGIKDKITSPTFILMRQHKLPELESYLYHLDLYRLEAGFEAIGLEEILSDPGNIVLIEWAEKIDHLLPKNATKISFEKLDNQSRKISIT